MFGTLKTLLLGQSARAEEALRDTYAIELIEQKIREADANLKSAKMSLASLIQNERRETQLIENLREKCASLTDQARQALANGRDDLATTAANAIAQMENETKVREQTVERLQQRILQLRQTIETANRRIIDLKQGAIAAKAVKKEQTIQSKMLKTGNWQNPVDEANELIAKILGKGDPFEHSNILEEIDQGLNHDTLAEQMADAGFGKHSKSTANDVLARLKIETA